jgi:hypothetical protein
MNAARRCFSFLLALCIVDFNYFEQLQIRAPQLLQNLHLCAVGFTADLAFN